MQPGAQDFRSVSTNALAAPAAAPLDALSMSKNVANVVLPINLQISGILCGRVLITAQHHRPRSPAGCIPICTLRLQLTPSRVTTSLYQWQIVAREEDRKLPWLASLKSKVFSTHAGQTLGRPNSNLYQTASLNPSELDASQAACSASYTAWFMQHAEDTCDGASQASSGRSTCVCGSVCLSLEPAFWVHAAPRAFIPSHVMSIMSHALD